MAKYQTKTTKTFTDKGFFNLDEGYITSSKTGETTDVLEALRLIAANGDEISITIKAEDSVDSIEE